MDPFSLGRILFWWVESSLIVYVGTINAIYFLLTVMGYFALRRGDSRLAEDEVQALLRSPLVPGVSVIAPAYNEERTVCDSVRSMLRLRHPCHEVIVVNDGSTDGTLALLIKAFKLYRSSRVRSGTLATQVVRAVYESRDPIRLVVIDKENGGKADSLNAGLNYARLPLFAAVDADSLLERDALIGVMKPFLEDPETVAAGGIVRVANGCRTAHGQVVEVHAPGTLLARLQAIEYLRAFLGGRVAFSAFNALLIISGAFGVFDRRAVIQVGGFLTSTVGEDMELVVRLHHHGCRLGRRRRIAFVPEPVCWTEVPESARVLRRQRNRWQRGALDSVFRHRHLLFHPRGGTLTWLGLPYFVLFEVFGPVVELIGYVCTVAGLATGLIEPVVAWQFFIVSILFGTALSVGAILLEELTTRKYPTLRDLALLLGAALVESCAYRQMTAVWRLEGIIDALRGNKSWGQMDRKGFASCATGMPQDLQV